MHIKGLRRSEAHKRFRKLFGQWPQEDPVLRKSQRINIVEPVLMDLAEALHEVFELEIEMQQLASKRGHYQRVQELKEFVDAEKQPRKVQFWAAHETCQSLRFKMARYYSEYLRADLIN